MQIDPAEARRANSRCGSLEEAALNELVAQLVEQRPFKAWVVGSIPTELTIQAAIPCHKFTRFDGEGPGIASGPLGADGAQAWRVLP